MNDPSAAARLRAAAVGDLLDAGLLEIGEGASVSPYAMFELADRLGTLRPIRIGAGCEVGPGAVLHGGVSLGAGARVEEHAVSASPNTATRSAASIPEPARRPGSARTPWCAAARSSTPG